MQTIVSSDYLELKPFAPSATRKTQLAPDERHLYSLILQDCTRTWFGLYQMNLTRCEAHLTTRRFIIEPGRGQQFQQWAAPLLKGVDAVGLGLDPFKLAPLELQLESDKDYTGLKGHTISIPVDFISGFELVKNILSMPQYTRLRFSDEGRTTANKGEFVFIPFHSKSATMPFRERMSQITTGGLGRIFAECGNEWLLKCRAEQEKAVVSHLSDARIEV